MLCRETLAPKCSVSSSGPEVVDEREELRLQGGPLGRRPTARPEAHRAARYDLRGRSRITRAAFLSNANVARLDRMPGKRAMLIALSVTIEGGTGGPTRVVASLEK